MKISFLGDTAFLKGSEKTVFDNIKNKILDSKIIISLESIFEEKGKNYKNIKNKISLKQPEEHITLLKKINPFLVNTSNNHSNDYGNEGAIFSKKLLDANNINNFGVGIIGESHNVFVDENDKIVFLSFTTRETDLTGSVLHETNTQLGSRNIDLEQIKEIRNKYKKYYLVILMHWGYELQNYPHPNTRILGRGIIDAGADLIVGSHSHAVQGYEQYKGKYIFYCLGNFLLNDIEFTVNGNDNKFYQCTKTNKSLIPILLFENNTIELIEKIYFIRIKDRYKIVDWSKGYNLFFFNSALAYKIFFFIYSRLNLFTLIWELKIYQLIKKYNEK